VRLLLDAFALIALLANEPAADVVETLLRRGGCAFTAINLAEALDVLQRVERVPSAQLTALTAPLLQGVLELLPVEERLAREGADIRARRYHPTRAPVSLADCVLVAAGRTVGAVATADVPLARVARAEGVTVTRLPSARRGDVRPTGLT
jgi:predicted nucleic acid-binding protein